MPTTQTKYFDQLDYTSDAVLSFPEGLLGFPENRQFLLIECPGSQPLSFLQNLEDPSLCFPVMPALQVDPAFQLLLDPQSCALLELPVTDQPYPPGTLLSLATVSFDGTGLPTANLKAPLVLHVAARMAAQVLQFDADLQLRHPVPALGGVLSCS